MVPIRWCHYIHLHHLVSEQAPTASFDDPIFILNSSAVQPSLASTVLVLRLRRHCSFGCYVSWMLFTLIPRNAGLCNLVVFMPIVRIPMLTMQAVTTLLLSLPLAWLEPVLAPSPSLSGVILQFQSRVLPPLNSSAGSSGLRILPVPRQSPWLLQCRWR